MATKKATLKQIAEEVGLSITSVSLVLNNRPCKITEENKELIREVARRRHYIPNQVTRSMVAQRSRTIGLIVPNIESHFFSSLAKQVEILARKQGYALFITNSDDTSENDVELVRLLTNRGVDGLLLVVSDEFSADRRLFTDLPLLPTPYVMVDRYIDGLRSDRVCYNNEQGGYLATKYLLNHGHKNIACIINSHASAGRERLAGYLRAHRECNVYAREDLIFNSYYNILSSYEVAKKVLDTDATAIFASSDSIALGVRKRLFENGLRVPDDYSLVSYDNSYADVLFEPSLTSIDQNVSGLAEAALKLLFKRIEETERREVGVPEEIMLQPKLIEKESVRAL